MLKGVVVFQYISCHFSSHSKLMLILTESSIPLNIHSFYSVNLPLKMIIEEFQVLSVALNRNALSKVFRFDNVISISITVYNV